MFVLVCQFGSVTSPGWLYLVTKRRTCDPRTWSIIRALAGKTRFQTAICLILKEREGKECQSNENSSKEKCNNRKMIIWGLFLSFGISYVHVHFCVYRFNIKVSFVLFIKLDPIVLKYFQYYPFPLNIFNEILDSFFPFIFLFLSSDLMFSLQSLYTLQYLLKINT